MEVIPVGPGFAAEVRGAGLDVVGQLADRAREAALVAAARLRDGLQRMSRRTPTNGQ